MTTTPLSQADWTKRVIAVLERPSNPRRGPRVAPAAPCFWFDHRHAGGISGLASAGVGEGAAVQRKASEPRPAAFPTPLGPCKVGIGIARAQRRERSFRDG